MYSEWGCPAPPTAGDAGLDGSLVLPFLLPRSPVGTTQQHYEDGQHRQCST